MRRTRPVVADQRESSVNTRVEQFPCHLDEGDRTFPRMHPRGEQDFFLRKAIGWALRDYARTDPQWVRAFVAEHELSPLSVREAIKHL